MRIVRMGAQCEVLCGSLVGVLCGGLAPLHKMLILRTMLCGVMYSPGFCGLCCVVCMFLGVVLFSMTLYIYIYIYIMHMLGP